MWKRAFMLLLTINILMFAAPAARYLSLPRLKTPPSIAAFNPNTTANVNVDVGANAVNKYLEAAIKEQPDVSRILSYVNIHFQENWNCDIGIKLDNRVAPFNVPFAPSVKSGDLDLQVLDATMNGADDMHLRSHLRTVTIAKLGQIRCCD